MEVKTEINLNDLTETNRPLKDLEPCFNSEGKAIAFECGNYLMLITKYDGSMFKKRVSMKHFKGDIN